MYIMFHDVVNVSFGQKISVGLCGFLSDIDSIFFSIQVGLCGILSVIDSNYFAIQASASAAFAVIVLDVGLRRGLILPRKYSFNTCLLKIPKMARNAFRQTCSPFNKCVEPPLVTWDIYNKN